jgi:hypothetical protein
MPFLIQPDSHIRKSAGIIYQRQSTRWIKITNSPEPLKPNQFGPNTPVIELIRQAHLRQPDLKYTDEQLTYLREGIVEGMQRVIKRTPEVNAEIRRIMADITIFCLSETHDNLLMWSHYAQNHSGVAIKFLSLPEVDSPLIVAQPVRYSNQLPQASFSNLMDLQQAIKDTRETLTLTKSAVWAYEKEWRIVAALRDKTKSYEILPYSPEEVGEIYLGCRISELDKTEILDIARARYPKAKVYEAKKHDKEFSLVFHRLI